MLFILNSPFSHCPYKALLTPPKFCITVVPREIEDNVYSVYAKIWVACITDALYEPSEANAAFCAKRETRRGEKDKAPAFRLFPNVPEIKEKQKKCLNLLLKRKDVLGLLPTRLEKSLTHKLVTLEFV